MNTGKKFAIADDHNFWRHTIIDIIKYHITDAEIVIEATNGRQLIEALNGMGHDSNPPLIILDLSMPIMDGYETARWLHLNRPETKILTLSLLQNETSIIRLLGYGVSGFLHKNTDGQDLVRGIESVLEGQMYFSAFKNAKGEDIHMDIGSFLKVKEVIDKWESLTKQEQEFIRWCCSDVEYNDIAKQMKIHPTTFESIKANMFKTFRAKNRISLFLTIYKSGLL